MKVPPQFRLKSIKLQTNCKNPVYTCIYYNKPTLSRFYVSDFCVDDTEELGQGFATPGVGQRRLCRKKLKRVGERPQLMRLKLRTMVEHK